MLHKFLCLLLSFYACKQRTLEPENPAVLKSTFDDGFSIYSKEPNTGITYDDLKRIISQEMVDGRPVKTLFDLLRYIKSNKSEHMRYWALAYESRSLQPASFSAPRVILYGSFNLTMAFTGDIRHASSRRLELMAFDPSEAKFRFHEIEFPSRVEDPVVFRDEPRSCDSCHKGKPIFDAYRRWPGFYGSDDDRIDPELFSQQHEEFIGFQNFLVQAQDSSKIYSLLDLRKGIRGDFENGPVIEYVAPSGRPTKYRLYNSLSRVTQRLSDQNFYRLVRWINENAPKPRQFFRLLREFYRWFGVNLPRSGPVKFPFPDDISRESDFILLQNLTTLTDYNSRRATIEREIRFDHDPSVDNYAWDSYKGHSLDLEYLNAFVRYLLELQGINMSDWSMTFSKNSYVFSTGEYGLFDFMKIAQAVFPNLESARESNDVAPNSFPKMGANFFAGAPQNNVPAEVRGLDQQAPLLRCMSCHTDPHKYPARGPKTWAGENPPVRIPFDNVVLLAQYLARGSNLSNLTARIQAFRSDELRMPPSPHRPLTADEVQSLMEFLAVVTQK